MARTIRISISSGVRVPPRVRVLLVSPVDSLFLPPDTNLWLAELISDQDEAFLSDGISNGFKLAPADSTFIPVQQGNYKSATNAAAKLAVEQTILDEIAEGSYVVTDTKPIMLAQ